MTDTRKTLLLWDGDCGFCKRAVEWCLKRSRACEIEAIPYQQIEASWLTPNLRLECSKAVHVRTPEGTLLRGGKAALFLLECMGWAPLARLLRYPPLIWLIEAGYHIVARNRALFDWLLFPRARLLSKNHDACTRYR